MSIRTEDKTNIYLINTLLPVLFLGKKLSSVPIFVEEFWRIYSKWLNWNLNIENE